MALEPDIVLVDKIEAAQIGQSVRAAKAIGESWRVAIAMSRLIEREHHIAATSKFNGETVLGFS